MSDLFRGENLSVREVVREVRAVTQKFEIVVRPPVALSIPVLSDGRLVLLKQQRPAIDSACVEFPAGRLDPGEDAHDAARRELREEIGFHLRELRALGSFLTAPHFSTEVIHLFLAYGAISRAPAPTDKEELFGVMLLRPGDMELLIRDGLLIDAKSIAAFMIASSHSLWGK